jgi:hypothetical protein
MIALEEKRTAKLQYNTAKITSKGEKVQNCKIALTKSLMEEMGFYEGCRCEVIYNLTDNEVKIKLKE